MAELVKRNYCLVTGGAGGIGSALCRILPANGYIPIVGFKSNVQEAYALASELGGFAVFLDMSDENSITVAVDEIQAELGDQGVLKCIVLGASPAPDLLPFSSLTSGHFINQYQINVVGPQLLLSKLIKKFFRLSKSGTVVGILTRAIGSEDRLPSVGMGAYVVAKAALKNMLLVCAAEYSWLKVKTVSPGFTRTKMLEVFDSRYLEMAQVNQKFSTPEEVAQLIIQEILS